MRLRIDLHVHTRDSGDSYVTVEDAARRCREESLDGFAVTNHDFLYETPISTLGINDLVVLPGMEVSARGAHILALDINEQVEMGLGIPETVERIHGQGGLAIIAHPYSVLRTWVNRQEICGPTMPEALSSIVQFLRNTSRLLDFQKYTCGYQLTRPWPTGLSVLKMSSPTAQSH